MKKILFVTLLATAAVITSAKAESNIPAPVIALVEQATLDKSDALKSIVDQVEKKRTEIQKELASYEKKLKDQDQKLSEEQKSLSEKEFADKRQAFEKQVHDIQEKIEIRRAQMELAVEEAKKKVYQAFLKVTADAMKEAGANMIYYKETVVTADPAFDLTSKVLEKLNKALPTVQVTYKSEDEVRKQLKQLSGTQPQADQQ